MPDTPLIEFPNELNGFMFAVVGAARFVRNLLLIHLLGFNPAFKHLLGLRQFKNGHLFEQKRELSVEM